MFASLTPPWSSKTNTKTKYTPLTIDEERSSSGEFLLAKENYPITDIRTRDVPSYRDRLSIWPWLLHLILLAISGTLFFKSMRQQIDPQYCIEKWSMQSPGLHNFDDNYELIRSDNSYSSQSIYKGPPSPERDSAWDRVTHVGAMSISEETRIANNASDGAVRLPESSGGGYMAMLMFVHELHCIDRLWKHTHPEYYVDEHNYTINNVEDWHEHADHCSEILRQKVMCNADVSVATYNWLRDHKHPHPNWNQMHKCRNFDAAIDWAIATQAPPPPTESGEMEREFDPTWVEYEELPRNPRLKGVHREGAYDGLQ